MTHPDSWWQRHCRYVGCGWVCVVVPSWLVHFVMPEKYTLDTLPTPNNPAVMLREIPARNYAVMRFSGFTGAIKVDKKITELMMWLKDKGIKPIGEPEMARYNAPWSLPFMRRNEIMVMY